MRKAGRLSAKARRLIEREPCEISPAVLVELDMLFERGRVRVDADAILTRLRDTMGLTVSETRFIAITDCARALTWTRDPFDRLIVANAIADGVRLVTADELILANFPDAVW